MFRVRHLVSESEIGHRIEDRIDDRLTSGPIEATVRPNPQGAGVAVLNREADQHPSLLRLREVEPRGLRGQAARQTEMGILVGPDWNDDRPETTVLLELRMEDVTRLDERGLDMGQIRGSIEAVDRLEFAQVRSHAEREPESLNDRPSRLEVHAGALRIKTQRA